VTFTAVARTSTDQWDLRVDEPAALPATRLVLEVSGYGSANVHLDGLLLTSATGAQPGRLIVSLDLTRSTGFHRLRVGDTSLLFTTEDAKLRLAGIEQMLQFLRNSGTGWTGQLLFSDGVALRDPHVVYAWLDQHADEALTAIERILQQPLAATTHERSLSRRGGKSLDRAATLRLLRSRPDRYLEQRSDGLLAVGSKRYDPLRVVVKTRTSTVETHSNRRAVRLLSALRSLTQEVLGSAPTDAVSDRCLAWDARASSAERRPLSRLLQRSSAPGISGLGRQTEEAIDPRYRTTYRLASDLARAFGWSASRTLVDRYSYVAYADQIYQAFVAAVLANAMNLAPTSPVLGLTSLAFSNDEFDLYYDAQPPPDVMRSWRAHSALPDTSRPDVLIRRKTTGEVLLLDAKYRRDGDEATEDSRKEVSAYMALYGLDHVLIAYPGALPAVPRTITARGMAITHIPVHPGPDLLAELQRAVPQLLGAVQIPPY
jgi:hypothetical protein